MMNQQHRGVSGERRVLEGKVVVVAVKASKDVPRTALLWALAYVVQPGDCVKVLVLVPAHNSGRKFWGLLKFTSDCTTTHRRSLSGLSSEVKDDIMASCSKLMHQLHDVYDSKRIKVKIKILADSPYGMVAVESRRAQAKWVVLDRKLKHEEKICMEGLQCNVVAMKQSRPMVLRLNLVEPSKILEPQTEMQDLFEMDPGPYVTPASSPEQGTPFTATDAGSSSISSSDPGASPFYLCRIKRDLGGKELLITEENQNVDKFNSDTDNDKPNSSSPLTSFWPWIVDTIGSWGKHSRHVMDEPLSPFYRAMASPFKALQGKNSKFCRESEIEAMNYGLDLHLGRSMREVISLPRNAPVSPPLCSKCLHQAPEFGKPPRSFSYSELEIATGGFSRNNFLAEGGFGSVHRGVLPDGQVIAVKQHKLASSQGDLEFCSEVEVLSCAQHRNVVTLIGFCVEENRRLLVYEYICNGSVACHLYGHNRDPLEWWARQNIAVGAARGLRYLHEECRVGCIVHRDLRPNNILITHDFEPLVGDFGLARWQPDGETGVTTRVIGTLGYLAPEYAQSGQITEKADVYSFGVVLVELITGRKAMDISRPKGQQCLTEWARPLLEQYDITKLVDPRLINYSKQEIYNMFHCASLCICRDPHSRPCMSQVLRMLEGDIVVNTANHTLTSGCNFGNSGRRMRIKTQHPCQQHDGGSILKETAKVSSRRVSNKTGKSTLLGEYVMGRRSRHGIPLIPTQR